MKIGPGHLMQTTQASGGGGGGVGGAGQTNQALTERDSYQPRK